jgi:hypothetical protein
MVISQQPNGTKMTGRATPQQRFIAAIVFFTIAGAFGLLWLAQVCNIDVGRFFMPCGFQQRFGLPCPTCWMTRSVLSFARGDILAAFYMQPAGGLLCCAAVAAAVLSFAIAVFGMRLLFIELFLSRVKILYIVLVGAIVLLAGWLVTLARVLTER